MIRYAIFPLLFALPAQAFTASNNMGVQATGNAAFSVPYDGDASPAAFWCAAGQYVHYALGQPVATRIYRTSSLPRHSGQGMDFTLTAADSAGKTGLIMLGGEDGSISAAHAEVLCLFARK
ncbi:MAG: hypothetical protein ABIV25_15630 [Paracoccaceae bacterium]